MGLAKTDGEMGAGFCVTWWRELSKSRKSRDLRAVGRRPGKKRRDLAISSFSLHSEEEKWGNSRHLATSASSRI